VSKTLKAAVLTDCGRGAAIEKYVSMFCCSGCSTWFAKFEDSMQVCPQPEPIPKAAIISAMPAAIATNGAAGPVSGAADASALPTDASIVELVLVPKPGLG